LFILLIEIVLCPTPFLFFLLLSPFVEQGFRKVDPDRWEFANEGFLRGQKHLLRSISRRKPVHGNSHQQPQQSHGQSSSVGACVEVGKFGLEEEVERLKRDKNVLMQELVRLRQQQQTTDNQLQTMVQRLQGMEQRQQQMMSFLAKAVQSPSFLAQFVQNKSSRRITETNKKRRLKQEGISESKHSTAPDGQIVKYQPPMNESATMLRQIMKMDVSSRLESLNNKDSFLIADGSSPSNAMDSGSSPSRISGVTLQEVPPTSAKSSYMPSASEISGHGPSAATSEIQSSPCAATSDKVTTPFPDMSVLVGAQNVPSISIPQADVIMPELSRIPEMMPGCNVDIPEETYNGGFLDPTYNGPIPIDIDNLSPDPDIDALLDDSNFWDDLLVQSPLPEEIESNSTDGLSKGNEAQPVENGWDKSQHLDKLTEQMGLLRSDAEGV
jgi:heat shock transcription factor